MAAATSSTRGSCKQVPADAQAQFRIYLEKGGAMDALTKALVPLMEEPDGALDVLKRQLKVADPGAVEEVEALHLEAAELQEKYRAALEENEELKAKIAHYETPQEEKQGD